MFDRHFINQVKDDGLKNYKIIDSVYVILMCNILFFGYNYFEYRYCTTGNKEQTLK